MPGQTSLFDLPVPAPRIDGPDLTAEDHADLRRDNAKALAVLQDGQPRTLAALAHLTGIDKGSIGSRVRDLRKPKFGGHRIVKEPTGIKRLWVYRLVKEA